MFIIINNHIIIDRVGLLGTRGGDRATGSEDTCVSLCYMYNYVLYCYIMIYYVLCVSCCCVFLLFICVINLNNKQLLNQTMMRLRYAK